MNLFSTQCGHEEEEVILLLDREVGELVSGCLLQQNYFHSILQYGVFHSQLHAFKLNEKIQEKSLYAEEFDRRIKNLRIELRICKRHL